MAELLQKVLLQKYIKSRLYLLFLIIYDIIFQMEGDIVTEERELERHNRILNQIKDAKTREDLPNVSYSTIASYLASNMHFDGKKISQTLFQPVVNEIINHGFFVHNEVKKALVEVIVTNYPNVSEEEIAKKYLNILNSNRINYILSEITQKNLKLDEIMKSDNLEIHKQTLKEIKYAHDTKYLPRVGLSELNKKLLRAVNDNDFITNIKTSEIKELTDAYLNHYTYLQIEDVIERIISKFELNDDNKELMKEQILGSLILDETIEYTVEEIELKEKRKFEIYKLNHKDVMDAIKDANRISELPPNLTISTVNGYLLGNTTIYTNDNRILSEDLKTLTDLLMEGNKFEDEAVINEIKNIAKNKYPEKTDAFELLYNKLSILPRVYYLVEEVNYAQKRQIEFIGRGSSNVNVYFIPNHKSPMDGGKFYNCYINRVGNLDLSQILPLDLDSIVPKGMDIDSVEWYVKNKFDPTFKAAGGIILNKDETIGNVSIFRPNDGTIGISLEEKEKLDEISNLDLQIEEKKRMLQSLNEEVETKEKQSQYVEDKIQQILSDYEKKALVLQAELLNSINSLKGETSTNEVSKIKTLSNKY